MSKVNYNPAQQEAIVSDKKYIRVIAGAGAGKTQVNSEVIAHKLNALGAKPEEILAITFSKNGATEIKDRAARTAGHVLPGLTATTFNALENEITLDNWEKFGFRHRPSVIDDVQDLPMCDILLRRHPILEWTGSSFKNYTMTSGFGTNGALRIVSDIMHHCSKLLMRKNFSAITYRDMIDDEIIPPASKELTPAIIDKIISFYPEYEEMKKGNDPEFDTPVITFDEQISYCMRVLEDDPNYLDGHYDFAYIIVDEAQDTSEDQIEFLNHIINMKKFKSLIVVGDDSQAIYESLMGTSPDYLINLQNFLYEWDKETGIKTPIKIHDIVMDTNYRSVGSVIEMANRVIDKNTNKFDKQLVAFREYGEKPTVEGFYRKEDQKPTKTQLKSKKPLILNPSKKSELVVFDENLILVQQSDVMKDILYQDGKSIYTSIDSDKTTVTEVIIIPEFDGFDGEDLIDVRLYKEDVVLRKGDVIENISITNSNNNSLLIVTENGFIYSNNGYHPRHAEGKVAKDAVKDYPYFIRLEAGTQRNVFTLANDKRETVKVEVVKTQDRGYTTNII